MREPCAAARTPDQCIAMAPPHPPSPLEIIEVDNVAYIPSDNTLHLTILWELPSFPNGEFLHHQLRIGSIPIPPQENSMELGTIFKQSEIAVTKVHDYKFEVL